MVINYNVFCHIFQFGHNTQHCEYWYLGTQCQENNRPLYVWFGSNINTYITISLI